MRLAMPSISSLRSILFVLSLFSVSVHADVLVVNKTVDDSSAGTLRWALTQHGAMGGTNEIKFAASLAGAEIQLVSNLPPINLGSLLVNGVDAPGLAILGNGRIFIVNNGTTLELQDIELKNSNGSYGGSCIYASQSTQIIVRRVHMTACTGENTATADAKGGAIRAGFSPGSTGTLQVFNSVFASNKVFGGDHLLLGGAIWVENAQLVRIEKTRFESNSAVEGGNAFAMGGAVYISNSEQAYIRESEFIINQATNASGGGLVLDLRPTDQAFIRDNLFVGNEASLGSAVWTGTQDISGSVPYIEFTHNTFWKNNSTGSLGGTLYFRQGQVGLRLNSFIANISSASGAANLAYNPSGTEVLYMWNNLFDSSASVNCKVSSGTPVTPNSQGYNLRADGSCNFNGFNDVVGSAGPFLPLGDYGGPTLSVPPAAGNLALDQGNPTTPGSSTIVSICMADDARGMPRPGDGDADGTAVCDIGAFEWVQEAPVFLDGSEDPGIVLP